MKVTHKTFSGGYRFEGFAHQPDLHITPFAPLSQVKGLVIKPDRGMTAANVLEVLGKTGFEGPEGTSASSKGMIRPSEVKDIIVSTVAVEPYDLPVSVFLKEETKTKFVEGLKSIRESYRHTKVTVILGEDQHALVHMLLPESDNLNWLEVATITAKYPANLKELAIPTVLGKKYPVGYSSTYLGILYLSVLDVLQVTKVIGDNKEAATSYVALSGSGWKENRILEIPVGTLVKDLLETYQLPKQCRLIKNSLLTGPTLNEEDRITFDTSVIIAIPEDADRRTLFFLRAGKEADSFTNSFVSKLLPTKKKTIGTNLHGERRACVSCTYCQRVCPVGLIPHLLHKHVDKKIINKRLAEYRIFDCIECGLCDYVCPSKIEVSTDIKKGKAMLEEADISHKRYLLTKCDMIHSPEEVTAGE